MSHVEAQARFVKQQFLICGEGFPEFLAQRSVVVPKFVKGLQSMLQGHMKLSLFLCCFGCRRVKMGQQSFSHWRRRVFKLRLQSDEFHATGRVVVASSVGPPQRVDYLLGKGSVVQVDSGKNKRPCKENQDPFPILLVG